MIARTHRLPVVRQCKLVELSSSTAYYRPREESEENLAVMKEIDWYSRKVLTHRLSNTLDAGFCVEAAEKAIVRYGALHLKTLEKLSGFFGPFLVIVYMVWSLRICQCYLCVYLPLLLCGELYSEQYTMLNRYLHKSDEAFRQIRTRR